MNLPYARVNQPYATLTLASALREMFGVQLYKNNARALLSRILSILNLDWLQHARSVRGVYEWKLMWQYFTLTMRMAPGVNSWSKKSFVPYLNSKKKQQLFTLLMSFWCSLHKHQHYIEFQIQKTTISAP